MTIHTPKVSIVIPVYNGSNFLAEAIDSALAQTYRNIEVIVINDGSNDNGETERIALSYGTKIRYFTKKNGGVASALNLGIDKMTGEFFSWLSHDDLYEKTKLEDQVAYLLDQPSPNNTIVACDSIALFENGMKKKEKINQIIFDNYFDIFLGASAKVGLNGCSLLIPRRIFTLRNRFREDLPVTQDYDLWSRLKNTARFKLLNKNLVVYRHHDMQDSIQKLDMSLIAGDDLRSRILQDIPSEDFAEFIESNKKSARWIWENYTIYKKRGYIKTSLALLGLLGDYYGRDSFRLKRVRSELLVLEGMYTIKTAHGAVSVIDNESELTKGVDSLIKGISDEHYKPKSNQEQIGRLKGYIESIKSDGLLFFTGKAWRKLIRVIRRSK